MAKSKIVIRDVYAALCRHYKQDIQRETLDLWERILGQFPIEYLHKAVEQWTGNSEVDEYTGKPCGSGFPSIVDLKSLMERISKKVSSGGKFESCGNCTKDGWVYCTIPGNSPGSTETAVKRCECFQEWKRNREIA